MKAAKLILNALTRRDGINVTVGGKEYYIKPPTIKVMSDACVYLTDFGDAQTLNDLLKDIVGMEGCAKALSVFVTEDTSLADTFSKCDFNEVVYAVGAALDLIDTSNFLMLLASVRNVQMLIAKPK